MSTSAEKMRIWRAANPERARRRARDDKNKQRSTPQSRERLNAVHRAWSKNNRGKLCAKETARKEAVRQRTPAWADLGKVEKVYEEARMMTLLMGESWHVDHVIPLQGKLVSGLHVHTNLQLLPALVNQQKKNKYAG